MNRAKLLQNPLPIDRMAARVVFGEADHWEPPVRASRCPTWDAPPKPAAPMPRGAVDYSGLRRGYMIAFRYHDTSRGGGGPVWLCRCDCGRYEPRRMGKWTKNIGLRDQCRFCSKAYTIKHGSN